MAERSIGSARADTGRAFVWALALFAILCGVILMLLGSSSGRIVEKGERESVKSVITDIDAAANALEDRDYGRTRAHLRSARKRLSRLDE
jgi:hypothetical protein